MCKQSPYTTNYQEMVLVLVQSNVASHHAGSYMLAGLTWVSPNASLNQFDLNALECWTGPMAEKPVVSFDSLQYLDCLPHPLENAYRFMLSASGYIQWLKAHHQNDIDKCLKECLTFQDVEHMLAWRLDQPGGVGIILDLTRDQREMNIRLYLQHNILVYYPWTLSAAGNSALYSTVAWLEGLGCDHPKTTSLDSSSTQCIQERWKFDYVSSAGQFYNMATRQLKIAKPTTLMPVPSPVHPSWGLIIPPLSHKDTGCQGPARSEADNLAATDSEQYTKDIVVQVDFRSHDSLDPLWCTSFGWAIGQSTKPKYTSLLLSLAATPASKNIRL
ncbi:hypothetical protein F4604DRAFT_1684455 [Suillus subluteus]|nr:hypothetical protein F4604DRAFT_1684455 [Suillus subluteus]